MKALLLIILLLSISMLALWNHTIPQVSGSPSQIVVSEGESIQAAINSAEENSMIFVKNGTYREQLLVNKSVSMVGENTEGVILDGKGEFAYIVNIVADGVELEGFTVRNSSSLYDSRDVHVFKATDVVLQNCRIEDGYNGILFTNSSNCKIFNNQIQKNIIGVRFHSNSGSNAFSGNTLVNNTYGVYVDNSSHDLIFYNSFIDNTYPYWTDGSENQWDNGYPSGGNYWSNYNGTDQYTGYYQNITGSDGLGDSPYPYAEIRLDDFPFINPIMIKPYISSSSAYYFLISSNLTIVDFNFYLEDASVNFTVKGINGTRGILRVSLPKQLMWVNLATEWIVIGDSKTLTPLVEEDAANSYLYFQFDLDQAVETVSMSGHKGPTDSVGFYRLLAAFVLVGLLVALLIGVIFYGKRQSLKQTSTKTT